MASVRCGLVLAPVLFFGSVVLGLGLVLAVLGFLGGAPVLPGLPSRSSSRCAVPACACGGWHVG